MKVAEDLMVKTPVLTTGDPMTRARQVLRDDIFREIPITNARGRYVGYINITDVLKITETKSDVLIEGFVREGTTVPSDLPLIRVAEAIRENGTDTATVVDDNRNVLGSVLLSEIFPILCTREDLHGEIKDYMRRSPPVCETTDTVSRAYAQMLDRDITAFAVMKNNTLTGIISRRDILNNGRVRKSLERGGKVPVESVMVTPPVTVDLEEDIRTAAERMVEHDLSQMPVMEGETLVGMIDRHDVLKGLHVKE
ncbi:CBS domain-containing protein [Methanofollis aquaemaris]|uniref:CBS domain-containing protein n=1 Tax=Methanofollis aquaemaris TaxID=126734 RepID=A0A8A3S6H9_9EURY|nr:CBS domain-containing protein [Methanofollis aquaemaris]QSZ67748.1 CBS domain-containing protein [Methanofollis aquaemaris]